MDDLLDVSRVTRGKLELRWSRVELAELVASAVEVVRPALEAAEVRLALALPQAALAFHGDATRLSQVLQNLLGNAAKFTARGGLVELAAEREGETLVVRVRDDGVGIPQAMLESIFEPFVQTHHTLERSTGGLGIGLTIARRVVELHCGTITAHSAGPGRGSEFVVRLPVIESPEVLVPRPPPGVPRTRRRILVADDNTDAVHTLARMLELLGQEVHSAHDGTEALRMATSIRPELVFLDLGMPGLNGYDCCRRLRAEPWAGSLRIFALTGWSQDEDRRRSRAAGFDGHLVKPIDDRDLAQLLGDEASTR